MRKNKKIIKTCVACGYGFRANNPRAVTCSYECLKARYRKLTKNKKEQSIGE